MQNEHSWWKAQYLKAEDLCAVTGRFSEACGCHVQPVVEEGGCVLVCFY